MLSSLQRETQELLESKGFDIKNTTETAIMKLIWCINECFEALFELMVPNPDKQKVGLELADILFYLLDVSERLSIELESSFDTKMNINWNREKHYGAVKTYNKDDILNIVNVFLEIHDKLDKYRKSGNFEHWKLLSETLGEKLK